MMGVMQDHDHQDPSQNPNNTMVMTANGPVYLPKAALIPRSYRPNPAYGPKGQWIVARPGRITSLERRIEAARRMGHKVSLEIYEAELKRLNETAAAEAKRQVEIANES